MKITAVVSDNSPSGPSVTHYYLNRMQICVPAAWSAAQAIEFAESKWHSITDYHWAIATNGEPHDNSCDLQEGHVHLNLKIEPNERSSKPTDSVPIPIHETTSHARVIINVDDSRPENILQTAASMDLLTRYRLCLKSRIMSRFMGQAAFLPQKSFPYTRKTSVWFAEVTASAKRSHNHPNLLKRNPNSNNSLAVIGGHSHYTQAGFCVRLQSLPERDNRSANDVSLESFNRRHGGMLLSPPLTHLARNNGSVLFREFVVVNVIGAGCFGFLKSRMTDGEITFSRLRGFHWHTGQILAVSCSLMTYSFRWGIVRMRRPSTVFRCMPSCLWTITC